MPLKGISPQAVITGGSSFLIVPRWIRPPPRTLKPWSALECRGHNHHVVGLGAAHRCGAQLPGVCGLQQCVGPDSASALAPGHQAARCAHDQLCFPMACVHVCVCVFIGGGWRRGGGGGCKRNLQPQQCRPHLTVHNLQARARAGAMVFKGDHLSTALQTAYSAQRWTGTQ